MNTEINKSEVIESPYKEKQLEYLLLTEYEQLTHQELYAVITQMSKVLDYLCFKQGVTLEEAINFSPYKDEEE